MRSAQDLLAHLNALGVELWCEGESLRYRAKAGIMSPSLIHEVRGLQQEIRELLLAPKGRGPSDMKVSAPAPQRPGTLPATSAQRRMWLLHQLAYRESYVAWITYRLLGPVDCEVLARSLSEIVRRHEALRTGLKEHQGELIQVIMPPVPVGLPSVDLGHLPTDEREAELRRIAREARQQPFSIERGEVLRALLAKISPQEHFLLLYVDHVAYDGWSAGLLVRELSAIYQAFAAGQPSPLAEPPAQYGDFAIWENAWLRSPGFESHLAYWRDHLRRVEPLELPTDYPRPAIHQPEGSGLSLSLAPRLVSQLQGLAKDNQTTLYVVLLTAFQVLLHRYTGQRYIAVGTPVANRPQRELEQLIGYFSNTVVMCSDLDGDPSFLKLLAQVRDQVFAAMAHSSVPFDRVVEELRPSRDLSRNQLYQVMFSFEEKEAILPSFEIPSLAISHVDLIDTSVRMDMELVLWPAGQGLNGVLAYDTRLFSIETVTRMMRHFEHLIESVVQNCEQPISALSLMDESERQALVSTWNGTATDYPRHASIAELFCRQVERTPDAMAVLYGERSLTYRELDQRSSQIAWQLRALGVDSEMPVGIFLERSPEMIIGMLGILKAGGAYLPLDLDYPDERLALMLSDAKAKHVVTEERFAARVRASVPSLLLFDRDRDAIAQQPVEPPLTNTTPENLAYIIYTSGSTGRPKGVAVTQRGVVRLVVNTNYLTLGPDDRVAQVSNAIFDAATFEIWGALLNGALLVGIAKEVVLTPSLLARVLREYRITTLLLMATLFNRVIHEVPSAFATLRTLCLGGEVLDPPSVRLALECGAPARLLNLYGPTEITTVATWHPVAVVLKDARSIPIGKAISNTTLYVLDKRLSPVPLGAIGELYIGGDGVARGYVGDPALTAQRFLPDPFSTASGARLYRTGDMVRQLADGSLDFLGRIDHQIKLRGFRIELGEIEATLARHPAVKECAVVVHERGAERQLVAYLVVSSSNTHESASVDQLISELKTSLKISLPTFMVPAHFEVLDALPLTKSDKLDRGALQRWELTKVVRVDDVTPPESAVEELLSAIWGQVLGRERMGIDDNFFDMGGHSLLLIQVRELIRERLQRDVPILDLFQHPTIRLLGRKLAVDQGTGAQAAPPPGSPHAATSSEATTDPRIAVIGTAGRFPGARSVAELWAKLAAGEECITFFSADDAIADGADPTLVADPRYVRAAGVLDDVEYFDAAFFGYSPREAEVMDPQHRVFLECVYEALETSGYARRSYGGRIGVFAGTSMSTYLLKNLIGNRALLRELGEHFLLFGNSVDFLPTRASYKLDLKGPSISLQTACSTSLVAVHLACQSLLSGECDIALAGGVTVAVPQRLGYLYQEGVPMCPDGHCRAFDADGAGIVSSNGAGVVVLKRLRSAIEDGDSIYAVIRGTAVNNDGALKAGFIAPSIAGQEAVIHAALATAGVSADSIGYVEAHGTGTPVGDPIEVAALTRAYRAFTERKQYCALGSIKTNLGHLDAAAGVAGLIKVVESLRHRQIPASLNFQTPNPKLSLETSPFFVNQTLRPWDADGTPRRAGVTALGIGGTNAHVIVEEAPPLDPPTNGHPYQLLVLSARTPSALEKMTANLTARLRAAVDTSEALPLADVAFTLQVGRQDFDCRRALVCRDLADVLSALDPIDESRVLTRVQEPCDRKIVFMFPGSGAGYVHMGEGHYKDEPAFRREIDRCAEILLRRRGIDLRAILYPTGDEAAVPPALEIVNSPPILFAIEYALAQLYMHWGIQPEAMLCHSNGEYVAACIAGVFKLEDALDLVTARTELARRLPPGTMLAVEAAAEQVQELLPSELSIAIIGTPSMCVVSGPIPDIEQLAQRLESMSISCRRVHAPGAGHSPMMEPILDEFTAMVAQVPLLAPTIPFTSCMTGTWITPEQATSPRYWARQMRMPVLFAVAAERCLAHHSAVFLEVGPGRTLSSWIRKHPARTGQHVILPSLRHVEDQKPDSAFILHTLAQLWLSGVTPTWPRLHSGESRRRIALPTYPFERKRFWIDPIPESGNREAGADFVDMRVEERFIGGLEQHLATQIHAMDPPPALNPALNALCISHIHALLTSRGGLDAGRQRRSALEAAIGVLPRFGKLFTFILHYLTEEGIATFDGHFIELTDKAAAIQPPRALAAELRKQLPEFAGLVDTVDHYMSAYADVLSGRVENVAVTSRADGSSVTAELECMAPYVDVQRYLRLAREVLLRLLRGARGRPLRVLEVGGGFGRMTWDLMPYLAGMDVEYWFTDVSRTFVLDAEKRARAEGWDFMRFATLDICADVSASGFSAESFDIILSLDVVHVARNLAETSELFEKLLLPGGVLLAIEATAIQKWLMAVAALQEGLWTFQDFRSISPLLTHAEWENFFRSRNLHSVQVHPRAPDRRARTDYALLVVQKPGGASMRRPAVETRPPSEAKAFHARPDIASAYVAPRNALEKRLADLWQGTLGIEKIGIHDDFFALGGDSLVALRLLGRTCDALSIRLPGHMLLRASTISALASAIAQAGGAADDPQSKASSLPESTIEVLQAGSDGIPLFLVPPSGGHLYCYRPLLQLLGTEQPIYGFVIPGIDGGSEPLSQVQELAAHLVRVLRAERPEGPCAIAGWSFGGAVAYEMAQQIQASGEREVLLALIDSVVSSGPQWLRSLDETSILASFAIENGLLPRDSLSELQALLSAAPPEQHLQLLMERSKASGQLPSDVTGKQLGALCQLFRSNLRAMSEYRPGTYQHPVVLFRASEKANVPAIESLVDSSGDRETLGWRQLCGDNLIVHVVSGNHYTMMESPGIDQIGSHLCHYLKELSSNRSRVVATGFAASAGGKRF